MNFTTVHRDGLIIGVWVHTADDPPQEEWDVALKKIAEVKKADPRALEHMRMLVITDGGSPNLKQRGLLNVGAFENVGVKTVALTTVLSNPLKRRLVQAILWTNPKFKAFAPQQWREALAYLGVRSTDVFDEANRMQAGLSKPLETLAQIRTDLAASP